MKSDKIIRVLQINSHRSIATSTGKQVFGLHKYFKENGLDSFVAFSQEAKTKDHDFFKYGNKLNKYLSALLTRLFSNRYGRGNHSTKKLIKIIKYLNPDIVHIHCINSYDVNIYKLLQFLQTNFIPFVITEHAEFYFTGSCSHALNCNQYETGCKNCPRVFFATKSLLKNSPQKQWVKMKQSFEKIKLCKIAAVSPWLLERSKRSPILAHIEQKCIFNGVAFENEDGNSPQINFGNNYFLFVTSDPKSKNKGLDFLFEIAKRMPTQSFLVVGEVYKNIIKANNLSNVMFAGKIYNQGLMKKIYSSAKATLILSKVETFSMVTAESLINGVPVFGFLAGGPESISIKKYCRFVKYGDFNGLIAKISKFDFSIIEKEKMIREAKEKYSFEKIGEQYTALYQELINEKSRIKGQK